MSRESRLIAILVVIAAVGVSGLMVVASQYRKALLNFELADATERAARLVDGYLAAHAASETERGNALSAHGMTEQDYAAVREAWRAFRVGGRVDDPALAAAFQARRSALEGADAVPVEAANGAIK